MQKKMKICKAEFLLMKKLSNLAFLRSTTNLKDHKVLPLFPFRRHLTQLALCHLHMAWVGVVFGYGWIAFF